MDGNQEDGTNSKQTPTTPPVSKKRGINWGFAGKTVWKYLNLVGVLLVPLMIGIFTILSSMQQAALANQQHDVDRQTANEQQQEATLQTYLDDMSALLLDNNNNKLLESGPRDVVR